MSDFCFLTGIICVIESWYKKSKVVRRVSLFVISNPLKTMFAGYIHATAYANLNGVHRMARWR